MFGEYFWCFFFFFFLGGGAFFFLFCFVLWFCCAFFIVLFFKAVPDRQDGVNWDSDRNHLVFNFGLGEVQYSIVFFSEYFMFDIHIF